MLDFALVREALKERGLLLERLAPHLVRPVPFLYPLQHKGWERLYAGSGVALYDAHGASVRARPRPAASPPPDPQARAAEAPRLRKDALVGALQYYDAQVDDARFMMTLVRTAASLRRAGGQPGPGDRLPARGRAGGRRPGAGPARPAASTRSGPGRWSTPPGCGPTTPRR